MLNFSQRLLKIRTPNPGTIRLAATYKYKIFNAYGTDYTVTFYELMEVNPYVYPQLDMGTIVN